MANVLLVEDDPALNAAYKTILEASGHTVMSAFNGEEALQILRKFNPKLILVDLLMPAMGGLEFLQNYKPKEHHGVKIFLFTNMETSPDVNAAYELGIESVVVKAMTSPQQLSELVNNALKK
jgi:CheY-like chemotaxis protein